MLKYLLVFLTAMVPVLELRGAIILGAGYGIPWYINYIICVVGNMLPIPFILLFIRHILKWMKNSSVKLFSKTAAWIEEKGHSKSASIKKYELWGLMIFVAIPLPGTGAWTGALIAALLDMRMKRSLPTIFLGVLIAGFIVSGAVYGFLGFLSFLA